MLPDMQKPDASEPEDTFEPIGVAARRVLAALAEMHVAKQAPDPEKRQEDIPQVNAGSR